MYGSSKSINQGATSPGVISLPGGGSDSVITLHGGQENLASQKEQLSYQSGNRSFIEAQPMVTGNYSHVYSSSQQGVNTAQTANVFYSSTTQTSAGTSLHPPANAGSSPYTASLGPQQTQGLLNPPQHPNVYTTASPTLTNSSPIRVVDEGYTGESENTVAGIYPESRLKVPSANVVTHQASISRSSSTPTIPTIPLSMKPHNQLDSTIQSITYNIGSANTQHQPSNYIGNAQVDTSMQSQNAAEDQEYFLKGDTDKDGKLSFKEFYDAVMKSSEQE